MNSRNEKIFSFVSEALAQDAFHVVEFQGTEGLGEMFQFTITLVSEQADHDLADIIAKPAVLTLHGPKGDNAYHGLVEEIELLHQFENLYFYQAVLRPKLWQLTLDRPNRLFFNKKAPDFLAEVLTEGGLDRNRDFEFRLKEDYPEREYVCQYDESSFEFLSRWMERDGLYYYFDPDNGKMIVTDSSLAHGPMPQGDTWRFAPPSGLQLPDTEVKIEQLTRKQRQLPASVLVKDYNYRTPSLTIKEQAQVSDQGAGQVYYYGEHARTPQEAQKLSKVRAEEILSLEKLFHGRGENPAVRSGFTYTVEKHYRDDMNAKHLVIETHHRGSQTSYLTNGLGLDLGSDYAAGDSYHNSWAAIPAGTQFRNRKKTRRRRLHGTMNAHVDAEGIGKYAEVDEHGRYKVILPFDLSGRKSGKASAWLRMAQPYGGKDHGFHFPLHKGVEVLLSFIDGDPDRPVIVGALSNPNHKSLVTRDNRSQGAITTGGRNKIHVEDLAGSERILVQTPPAGTFMRHGAPNDPPSPPGGSDEDGFVGHKIITSGLFELSAGSENQVVMIENSVNVIGGVKHKTVVIGSTGINLAIMLMYHDPWNKEWTPFHDIYRMSLGRSVGLGEAVEEENVTLAQSIKKIRQQETKLAQNKNELTQQITKLKEQKTKLIQERNALVQDVKKITQTKQTITEEKDALAQEITEIKETQTSMVEQKTSLIQQRTSLKQNKAGLKEMKTELSQMKTTLTEKTKLAETQSELATLITKL